MTMAIPFSRQNDAGSRALRTYAPINGLPQNGGGGGGNPRELDLVKCTWVGNLTS